MKKYLARIAQLSLIGLFLPSVVNGASKLKSDVVTDKGFTLEELENLIGQVAGWFMTFGVIIAVIFIMWGGVQYMLAGGDDEKAKKARTHIFNGIIGVAVILAAGIIVRTVMNIIGPNMTN